MNVLITGINGFIGQSLYSTMQSLKWQVRGTVRSLKNVEHLQPYNADIRIATMNADFDWSEILDGVEIIIHLAARVHMMHDSASDPAAAFREVNVSGTGRLAREAAAAGVKCFVFMSSVKVCGEGKQVPYTERDTPVPEDLYGVSKWEAEQVLSKVADETGLKVVILRSPLVYGPHVKANFLRMLKLIRVGLPLPLGTINNRRSMIYVGNLVDAILNCIKHPKAAGETFLVSDGDDASTPQLIRMIASAMGKKPRLLPIPPVLLNMMGKVTGKSAEVERLTSSLCVDCDKIRTTLGWKPPLSMEAGIRDTVRWFMEDSDSSLRTH